MDPRASGCLCGGSGQFFALAAARLKDWVRHQLWLKTDLGGGLLREDALQQAQKAGASVGASLQGPPAPPVFLLPLVEWLAALAPVYDDAMLRPAMLAEDIRVRFGIEPNPRELSLLMELFGLWQQTKNGPSGL